MAVLGELRHHFGDRRLDHPELRTHIQVEREFPFFVAGLLDVAVVHKARAVEDHVDAVHAGHLARDGVFVEHVQHGGVHVRHALVRLEQLGVHIGRVNGRTFSGHGQCSRLTNALPGSGHQCGFSFESHGA
jgi:hypothetical protein